jgi:hypothetical protein
MRRRFGSVAAAAVFVAVAPLVGVAQVNLQPTPAPTITAEERSWFVAREPVVFAGSLYYPGGPQVFFNRFEMVRSGYYDLVPLYTRTTIEPYSILFVPVAGGLMQPYERPRAGELAGTAGSVTPSYSIARPSPISEPRPDDWVAIPQAAGPPSSLRPPSENVSLQPASSLGIVPERSSEPAVATTGVTRPAPPGVFRSAEKPQGLNGIFIEHSGQRWFNNGPAVSLTSIVLVPSGTYRGLTVYVKPGDSTTIYIPVAEPADSLVTPYALRRGRR